MVQLTVLITNVMSNYFSVVTVLIVLNVSTNARSKLLFIVNLSHS